MKPCGINLICLTIRACSLGFAVLAILTVGAAPGQATVRDDVKRLVVEEALNSRVPPSLALAVAKIESDIRKEALSPAGARGVMQIMPRTARGEYGVDPEELWDSRLNVQLGIDFLERLIDRYDGRWDLALSHYNGGSVTGALPNAEPLPATRQYVAAVLRWQKRYADQAYVWRLGRQIGDSWHPARTRLALLPDRVAHSTAGKPAGQTKVEMPKPTVTRALVPSYRMIAVATIPARRSLDDFDETIELRRLRARRQLDDFASIVRWVEG